MVPRGWTFHTPLLHTRLRLILFCTWLGHDGTWLGHVGTFLHTPEINGRVFRFGHDGTWLGHDGTWFRHDGTFFRVGHDGTDCGWTHIRVASIYINLDIWIFHRVVLRITRHNPLSSFTRAWEPDRFCKWFGHDSKWLAVHVVGTR